MSSLIFLALFTVFYQNALESLCLPLEIQKEFDQIKKNEVYFHERLAKATEIHSYMNESVDPCADFYAFSCGNWTKVNPDVEDLSFQMKAVLDDKVKQVLQSSVDSSDNEIDKKVKTFHQSCITYSNSTNVKDYHQQLLNITKEFGGMPAVMGDDWDKENFNWFETIVAIKMKYDKDIILNLELLPFSDKHNKSLLAIQEEWLRWNRAMYVDNETTVYHRGYVTSIATNMYRHLNLTMEKAKNVAREIFELEKSLAAGLYEKRLGLDYNTISALTTLSGLARKYGSIMDIKKVMKMFAISVNDNKGIYVRPESYLRNLLLVLKAKPKHIVANYIMYNLLEVFFTTVTDDTTVQETTCIKKTKEFLTISVYNMINRRYNTEDSEREIFWIWTEIKASAKDLIQSKTLNWISSETRQKVIAKVDAMKMRIGFNDITYTQKLIDIQIKNDDYFGNMKNILRMEANCGDLFSLKDPKRNTVQELYTMTPFYNLKTNEITFPLMYLEPKFFFIAGYPTALKFGAIGTLIAHELTHGFDDTGRKFYIDDKVNNQWDEDSDRAFEERKKCFIEQYSHYKLGDRFLPKSQSQGENIADAGGIRFAYNAYLRWLERNKHTANLENLPNMNFTNTQLFFISYAQLWCSHSYPSAFARIRTGVHAPSKFRVIGPLSNFAEFAKEFNCGLETPMNRGSKRCEIY